MNSHVCLPTNLYKDDCMCVGINTAMKFLVKVGICGRAGVKILTENKLLVTLLLCNYFFLDMLICKLKLI